MKVVNRMASWNSDSQSLGLAPTSGKLETTSGRLTRRRRAGAMTLSGCSRRGTPVDGLCAPARICSCLSEKLFDLTGCIRVGLVDLCDVTVLKCVKEENFAHRLCMLASGDCFCSVK